MAHITMHGGDPWIPLKVGHWHFGHVCFSISGEFKLCNELQWTKLQLSDRPVELKQRNVE